MSIFILILITRFFQCVAAGNNLGPTLTEKLSKILKCEAQPDIGTNKVIYTTRLYPPGTVYFIHAERKRGKYDIMEQSAPSLFSEIIISICMFADHLPDVYENSLINILERLKKEKEEGLHAEPPTPKEDLIKF
jgi:hypothetical protein